MLDNRSGPRPAGMPLPSQEVEEQSPKRTPEPPKHFETRSEWEQWKNATFPSQQKFEQWQRAHRAEDIDSLRSNLPEKTFEYIRDRGHALASAAANENGTELTNIRNDSLRQFVLQNRALAHHALNPGYINKSGEQQAWGAASFASAQRTLDHLTPIAKRHGINLEGLSLEEAKGALGELRYAIESSCERTGRRGRPDRQSTAALRAIKRFHHQYAQGVNIQQEKAEQLWAAYRFNDKMPDYITTAGYKNSDGLAAAMRHLGPDSDGNGKSDAYDTHIARVRMRTGAGLSDPEPESKHIQASSASPVPVDYRGRGRNITHAYRGRLVPPAREAIVAASLPSAGRQAGTPPSARRQADQSSSTTSRYDIPRNTYVSSGLREYRHWKGELEKGRPLGITAAQTEDVMFKHYALNIKNHPELPQNVTREEGARLGLQIMAGEYCEDGNLTALAALQNTAASIGISSADPMFQVAPQTSPTETPINQQRFNRPSRPQAPIRSPHQSSQPETTTEPKAAEDPFSLATAALEKAQSWYESFQTNTPGESMSQALERVMRFRDSGKISAQELTTMAAAMGQYAATMEPSRRAEQQAFAQMLARAAVA